MIASRIEDGNGGADLLCAKIECIRAVAVKRGVELFVNARPDVYLFGLLPKERRLEETLARKFLESGRSEPLFAESR